MVGTNEERERRVRRNSQEEMTDALPIIARKVKVDFGDLHFEPISEEEKKQQERVADSAETGKDWKVVPLDWYDNNAAITEMFHALSITFPVGETFFIDSVMHYAPILQKEHPELWEKVRRLPEPMTRMHASYDVTETV